MDFSSLAPENFHQNGWAISCWGSTRNPVNSPAHMWVIYRYLLRVLCIQTVVGLEISEPSIICTPHEVWPQKWDDSNFTNLFKKRTLQGSQKHNVLWKRILRFKTSSLWSLGRWTNIHQISLLGDQVITFVPGSSFHAMNKPSWLKQPWILIMGRNSLWSLLFLLLLLSKKKP